MAKATVAEPEIIKIPGKITLELSVDEAKVIEALLGSVSTPGVNKFPGGDEGYSQLWRTVRNARVLAGVTTINVAVDGCLKFS